mgnify:CR=1 FL=1
MKKLILYNGPNSPFWRKTKITAIILEIPIEEKIIKIQEAEFIDNFNPLRKIPTLVIDDKQTIMDSDNICLYFDSISKRKSIYPNERYWECMTMISISNGIMENAVSRYIETSAIPEDEQRAKSIERYEKKILRSIQWIENKFDEFVSDHLTMDQISVACALDYTSLRLNSNWGENNPKLKTWLERLTENNFMKSTLPGESFKYE